MTHHAVVYHETSNLLLTFTSESQYYRHGSNTSTSPPDFGPLTLLEYFLPSEMFLQFQEVA